MFMRALLPLLAGLSASGLVACTLPESEPVETTSSSATAVIVVERTAGPGETVRGDAVTARFVRVSGGAVDDSALRMAGVATDIPAAGTCITPSDDAPSVLGRAVELLDVGPVTLTSQATEGASKSTVLMPRLMPDPAGVVSGVVYSSRSADVFSPSSRVTLRASGGADLVEGFNVTVTAPHDVADVRVTPVPGGLEVSWDAAETHPHDLVYVDVLFPAPRVAIRCAGTDSGRLLVPHVLGVDEGQIAVHRLHKEGFRAKGIEPGEVRFDVARVVTFRR
jgi:hypothetical protein